jgi:3-oxoacyl-[acyl-carrier-protein] synthase-3
LAHCCSLLFYQANRYRLEHLRRKLRIAQERFAIEIDDVGNTLASTIPSTLAPSYRD